MQHSALSDNNPNAPAKNKGIIINLHHLNPSSLFT